MEQTEEDRRRAARTELANRLYQSLGFALVTNLTNEAVLINKLIDAVLTNTTIKMYQKITKE